jgi:glycosyltransferase involved in cell wall biosynthesis
MKTLFIGSIVEEEIFERLISKSKKSKPSIAGQRFERMIAEGMNETEDTVELLSYLPAPSFPNNSILFSGFKNSNYSSMSLTYIPLININIVKQLIIMAFTFYFLLGWCARNRSDNINILLNVVYVPTALPTILISKIFRLPIVVVVPDVSTYRFSYTNQRNVFKTFVAKFSKFLSEKFDGEFDGYVLLTKEMNKLVNKKNKPHIVIEGMIEKSILYESKKTNRNKKVIMYAGSLREKYGISKLLKAFLKLEESEVEFWIFGSGDFERKIKKISSSKNNIKFFGLKNQSEVFRCEQKADLLVNPRPSNEEFTIYSFPSKTLEYMSSGTPMLTTKLPGIPEEYFNYLFTFDDESVEGMKKKLIEILGYDDDKLNTFGQSAREFVIKNKNYIVQTQKINQFLKSMDKELKGY